MTTPTRACLLAICAALLLAASAVRADTIEHEITVTDNGYNFYAGANGSFQLPKFDSKGGKDELVWVALSVTATSIGGSTTLDSEHPIYDGYATIGIGVVLDVDSDTVTTPMHLTVIPESSASGYLTTDDPTEPGVPMEFMGFLWNPDFVGPDSITVQGGTVSEQDVVLKDAVDHDLSEFIGTDMMTWTFESDGHAWAKHNLMATKDKTEIPEFTFVARVIYGTEIGVPEPASGALVGLGCILPLLRRRRRRKKITT